MSPVSSSSNLNPACALAIDIGTSGVRGALYDDQGSELPGTSVQDSQNLLTKPGDGADVRAEALIEQVALAIDALVARVESTASRIEIVAFSCFWHSLVGVDENGEAVTPLLGWADTRAAQVVDALRLRLDEGATHARTGCRFHPSYWPAKLLWLKQQDGYRATTRWLSFSDFLFQRFFGKSVTSVSMASGTGLFNQRSCAWDETILCELGVGVEQLSGIAADGESFSNLVPAYSKRWPQLNGAKWIPAIGDGATNNIGAGCLTRERVALMIGTSGAMRVLWQGTVPDEIPPALWCYRADRKRVVTGGALSDGGGLFAWMKASLKLDGSNDEIESALDELKPDNHGLTILPFWAGERSTGWHASARGVIDGMKQDTRPIEILRATMEAIAYRFALIADSLDQVVCPYSIIASGGALVSSPVWTQMLADVLDRPVMLANTREASSRGAVLLALEMEGRIRAIADAPLALGHTYEPDMTRHARYREGLERQEKLYARMIT